MKKIFLFLIICILSISLSSCETPGEIKGVKVLERMSFEYFDTVSYVYSYANDSEVEFNENCNLVFEIFEKYNKLFDIYYEYEGINNLCTINKNAGGDFIICDKLLIEFLIYAKDIYNITKGETNVMLGSVLREWSNTKKQNKVANIDVLKEKNKYTNIEYLEIDAERSMARISKENASIDVGAIGKGYATEKAARMLEEKKCNSYVLNIGGNVRIIGTKIDGSGWITGIKNPFETREVILKIELANTSCVTSGDYERYYEVDGNRYHHIIDKDTLFPANYFSSVTIVTKDSALADAMSTALFCMPYEEGKMLIESIANIDAVWIDKVGNIKYTEGIKIKE